MAKNCPDCGTKLDESAAECPNCHLILQVPSRPRTEKDRSSALVKSDEAADKPRSQPPKPPSAPARTPANTPMVPQGAVRTVDAPAINVFSIFLQIVIAAIIAAVVVNEKRLAGSEGFITLAMVFLAVMLIVSILSFVFTSLLKRKGKT